MKKIQQHIDKVLNRGCNTTPPKSSGASPMSPLSPRDVTSSQVPKSSEHSPKHQDTGTTGSTSSGPPPQMFPHASNFKISGGLFATGPVSVTNAAERNTEEILKVSLYSKNCSQISDKTRNMF